MRISRLLLLLTLLAITSGVLADEAALPDRPARGEYWRRQLGTEEALGESVDSLHAAFEGGEISTLAKIFRDGPLLLQIMSEDMPLTLCGGLQARALLTGYFRIHEFQGLRVSQLRLAPSGHSARVALDLIGAPVAPGRPDRRRIVARLMRGDDDGAWRVVELRCP